MLSIPSTTSQSELDRWLANLGFVRGNPFATAEANQEQTLLPEFFVDVDGYEQIQGDRSLIVFAPRGAGKSALRVVLSNQAASNALQGGTLAVEFSDFDDLIAMQRSGHNLTVGAYMPRLLRAGVRALLEALCGRSDGEPLWEETVRNRQHRAAHAATLLPPTRSRLKQALRTYYPSLLDPTPLYERLHALDTTFMPAWAAFVEAIALGRLHAILAGSALAEDEIGRLLADLIDYPDVRDDFATSPVERLTSFVELVRATGMASVHFLIDRLDEHAETVDDPQIQADILEPLLAHLQILELSGVAFKFFLSQEARDILLRRPTVRRDRLTDRAVTVIWDAERLKKLLRLRLIVYSAGQVDDLILLCRDVRVPMGRDRPPLLLGLWIEDRLIEAANRSPRRLLVGAQLLCQAHVQHSGSNGLLTQDDWEAARQELWHRMPLLLLLANSPIARIGERKIKLTPLEQRILHTLAQSPGLCDRDTLARKAWDSSQGVSNESMDRAIARLREKLGDHADTPIYIGTERNLGFKLLNYAIE